MTDSPTQSGSAEIVETINLADLPVQTWVDEVLVRKEDEDERQLLEGILRISRDIDQNLTITDKTANGTLALAQMKTAFRNFSTFLNAIRVLDCYRHGKGQKYQIIRDGEAPLVPNGPLRDSDAQVKDLFMRHLRSLQIISEYLRKKALIEADRLERYKLPPAQLLWQAHFEEARELSLKKYFEFFGAFQDLEARRLIEIRVEGSKRGGRREERKKPELYLVGKGVEKARNPAA